MPKAINTKVFRKIDDIGQEALDSMVDDGFFNYGWFKTLELSKHTNLNPFYITAFIQDKLVAFAPCFLDSADEFYRFSPKIVKFLKKGLNVGKKLHLSQSHFLLCYSPSCYRSKIFIKKELNQKMLIKKISKEIDKLCKKEKILFSSFLFVSEFDEKLSQFLCFDGYHKIPRTNSTFYLPVVWNSFEDYLNSLDRKIRKNIKREMRYCKENEVNIQEISDFKNLSNTLANLSAKLYAKYNHQNAYKPKFYEILNKYYSNGNAKLFLAKKNGDIIGFSLNLKHKETVDAFNSGFNYRLQKKSDFAYFNVVYYYPIRWAIREGIKKIYYRYTNDKVKTRRGCQPERSFTLIKCHKNKINYLMGKLLEIKELGKQIFR